MWLNVMGKCCLHFLMQTLMSWNILQTLYLSNLYSLFWHCLPAQTIPHLPTLQYSFSLFIPNIGSFSPSNFLIIPTIIISLYLHLYSSSKIQIMITSLPGLLTPLLSIFRLISSIFLFFITIQRPSFLSPVYSLLSLHVQPQKCNNIYLCPLLLLFFTFSSSPLPTLYNIFHPIIYHSILPPPPLPLFCINFSSLTHLHPLTSNYIL